MRMKLANFIGFKDISMAFNPSARIVFVHASAIAAAANLPSITSKKHYVGRTRTEDSPFGFSLAQRASMKVARASPIPATRYRAYISIEESNLNRRVRDNLRIHDYHIRTTLINSSKYVLLVVEVGTLTLISVLVIHHRKRSGGSIIRSKSTKGKKHPQQTTE